MMGVAHYAVARALGWCLLWPIRQSAEFYGGFRKLGYLIGGSHHKDYSILGSILGPPILETTSRVLLSTYVLSPNRSVLDLFILSLVVRLSGFG